MSKIVVAYAEFMKFLSSTVPFLFLFLFFSTKGSSQLIITESQSADALAQKLVGEGVVISNATLTTSSIIATGFFNNIGNTNIRIDSGVVLTNGRVKSDFNLNRIGLDGDGNIIAASTSRRASANLLLPGDLDLSVASGIAVGSLYDAVILEFDVIPLGDTIKFRYSMSSEEYFPSYVCTFNDAFALLISGPGITGKKNLAIVPGTNLPVTITNVNNVLTLPANCPNNPQYYVSNTSNVWFTHDGHTKVFTAISEVQPCQTYHLKFVVADRGDHILDSGVFIEAKSLSSDPIKIDNQNPLNESNQPFVAEGCHVGAIHITRSAKKPFPQSVNLSFGGTAVNGVDLELISTTYTIPANDSFISVPIIPIADFIQEANEKLKIYVSSGGCSSSGVFLDSIEIEIRDINMLTLQPQDSGSVCRSGSLQLTAEGGYLNYTWTGTGLSDPNVSNPFASPPSSGMNYTCTAIIGSCTARDSVFIKMNLMALVSKQDVFCQNGTNGQIVVSAPGWQPPVSFSINNQPFQVNNVFTNLGTGSYTLKAMNQNCIDSITVTLMQAFPDLTLVTSVTNATCSSTPDGSVTITAAGGNNNYSYSIDGSSFQPLNVFVLAEGSYNVFVKDGNNCVAQTPVTIGMDNGLNVEAGANLVTCEGTAVTITSTSTGQSFAWSPSTGLTNPNVLAPAASPSTTTLYYVTATLGRCTKSDSVLVTVRPAPVAVAGADVKICHGETVELHGSGGVSYQWMPTNYFIGASNLPDVTVRPLNNITYYLHVTDANQCHSLKPDTIVVRVVPEVRLFAGNDTTIAINQPLHFNLIDVNNSGVTQFTWTPAGLLSDATIQNPVATIVADIIYSVTAKTPEGCEGYDQVRIKAYNGPEIYVPKGFTPNADGLNDILKAIPVGMKEFHFFRIYNRWGQLVFSTSDPSKGWDGKIKGIEQNTGTYLWIAEAVDFKGQLISRKGTITIVR